MKDESLTYTVGVIGFERPERRALRRLLRMAEGRQPSFKPFDKHGGGYPQLILVDAERPSAMRAWHRFRRANAHRASFAPIFVGRNLTDLPPANPYVLQRPILATRMFEVLDQAVAEVHGFRPAVSVMHGIVALTQREIETTPETAAAPAVPSGVSHAEPDECSETCQTAECNALVVDDSLWVRVQMRRALTSIASRVDFAQTGEQALELVDAHRYSVIFLDSTLPDEDSFEFCGRIKKHPLQQEAVVVMLTSSCSPADRVMGSLAGFDNYLVKPIQRAMFNGSAAGLIRPAAAI